MEIVSFGVFADQNHQPQSSTAANAYFRDMTRATFCKQPQGRDKCLMSQLHALHLFGFRI